MARRRYNIHRTSKPHNYYYNHIGARCFAYAVTKAAYNASKQQNNNNKNNDENNSGEFSVTFTIIGIILFIIIIYIMCK